MKTGELIASLLEKAGVDTSEEKYKDLLSIGTDVPKEGVDAMNALMTVDAAKNSHEVKSYFYSRAYDGIDKEISKRAEKIAELSGDKDIIEKINQEQSTGKKNIMLLDQLEKLANKKPEGKTPEEDKKLKEQIAALNTELSEYKEKYVPKEELDKLQSNFENERLEEAIMGKFMSQKWSEQYPERVRKSIARELLNEELNKKGAKPVRKDGEIKLVQAENPDLDYFDKSNKVVNFDTVVQEIMTANKLQAVSEPPKPGTPTPISGTPEPGTQQTRKNPVYDLVEQSKRDQDL